MGVLYPEGWASALVEFTQSGDSEPMAITWGIGPGGITPSPVVAAALAQDTVDVLKATGAPLEANQLYTNWTFVGVTVTIQGPLGGVSGFAPAGVTGTSASPQHMPVNVAVLVHKLTSAGGRRGRGRMYLPPFALGDASVDNNGVVSSALVTAWNTRWAQALSDLALAGATMYLGHSPDSMGAAIEPTLVSALQVDTRVATQRTRLRR